MPPRKSSRAASAKPAAPATGVAKPAVRAPRSQPAKRAAAERSPSPPPKRKRTEEKEQVPPKKPRSKVAAAVTKKPPSKTKTATTNAAVAKKPKPNGLAPVREEVPQKPYFNALPTAPAHTRPSPQLFVWGAGNFGQFGMGTDFLGEFGKPKKSGWIEEQIEEGIFGGEGAGLEAIAAGGLHTLMIDEKGTVSTADST